MFYVKLRKKGGSDFTIISYHHKPDFSDNSKLDYWEEIDEQEYQNLKMQKKQNHIIYDDEDKIITPDKCDIEEEEDNE